MLAEGLFKEAESGSEPLGLCSPGSCPTPHRIAVTGKEGSGVLTPSPQSPAGERPVLCLCRRRACHGCTGTAVRASGCQADPPRRPACASCTVSPLATGVLSSRHSRVLLPLGPSVKTKPHSNPLLPWPADLRVGTGVKVGQTLQSPHEPSRL